MTIFSSQKGKKIGIFGLGKTGIAAYRALKNSTREVICYDEQAQNNVLANIIGDPKDLADLSDGRWQHLDKILISPGIPPSHKIFKLANSYHIPITSDIDILFEECSNANFIAVTGTNGKSTTTVLTAHILNSAGFYYPEGGNIGIAALSLPLNQPGYVMEVSSFQLNLFKSFKAAVAILLNITPDHLDRYKTMEAYIDSKKQIFSRQGEGEFSIIGVDNEITNEIFISFESEGPRTKLIPISAFKLQQSGVTVLPGEIHDNIFEPIILNLPENKFLQGAHNRENIAASYAACRVVGVDPDKIITGISTFQGLPHRMQYIGTNSGISFYNDSKATNSDAAAKSISALDNIYWLAGGIAKEGGIENLVPYFSKIKKAYFYGQDKELFAKTADGKISYQLCSNLEEAFHCAVKDAMNRDITHKNILLAPAAASYDQFKNFEERGELFIKLYKSII
jgi:UDP-N-acetylmuramoylalanine--D-glutamate ligase